MTKYTQIYDIRDYGAIGNNTTNCTESIQKAIDDCEANGGGTVLVAGGKYLSYTLRLKSGVKFEIEANASVVGGSDPALYPEIEETPVWRPAHCSRMNRRTLFYAENVTNIALTGRGEIYGSGEEFMLRDDKKYDLHCHWKRQHDTLIPGRTILFVACKNVLLEDVSIMNSAGWSTWFLDCDNIHIHRIKIDCDFRVPNVDGIHISSCRDVTVSDCIIKSSDDAIVIRAHQEQLWEPKPCERVTVSNCCIQSGSSAIRIGWSNDYEIRDCTFSNLTIKRSFCGFSVLIPPVREKQYDPPRGEGTPTPPPRKPFLAENILLTNITMEVDTCFMNINLGEKQDIKSVQNIIFNNIQAVCGSQPFIRSLPEYNVRNIVFDNVQIEIKQPERKDLRRFICFNPYMEFDNVEDLQFNNFKIRRSITPEAPEI